MKDNNRLLSLQNKYNEILLEDGGLRTLCGVLTEDINNFVFILDKYRENLLYIDRKLRQDMDFYDYLDYKKLEKKEVVYTANGFHVERVYYSWKNKEYTEIQARLGGQDELLGYLVILEENILDEDDYLALTQGINAISLKLHQNYIIQSLSQRCSNELIENLLQGRVKDREKLIKSGELAGWDLTVSYQLFVIKANFSRDLDKDTGGHGLYTYEMEEKIINSLHRIIRTNISRKYIIFSYQGDILLLINYEDNSKEIRDDIEILHQQLSNRFQGVSFSIGGGSFVRDCCMIADSYQQALYSLEFLAITNEVNRVLFYEDLGVLRLLWQVDCRHLMKFTDEFLKELIAYDLNNNSNWVDTLGAFLQEGCSIQYAAKRLHIHPNTMRYRIERIQEILGLDLRDFETQLNLTTAYKIHKFIICSCEEGG